MLAATVAFLAGCQLYILRAEGGWRELNDERRLHSRRWHDLPRVPFRQAWIAVTLLVPLAVFLLIAGLISLAA